MNNTLRKNIVGGLAALVGLVSTSGCEKQAGSDYNKIVGFPPGCEKVLSAGFSNSTGQYGDSSNTDWISCLESKGNVTIYRMNKADDDWYSTQIKK